MFLKLLALIAGIFMALHTAMAENMNTPGTNNPIGLPYTYLPYPYRPGHGNMYFAYKPEFMPPDYTGASPTSLDCNITGKIMQGYVGFFNATNQRLSFSVSVDAANPITLDPGEIITVRCGSCDEKSFGMIANDRGDTTKVALESKALFLLTSDGTRWTFLKR